MAEVELKSWSAALTRQQYLAIAWLRWRIFRNGLRRKNNVGELIANVLTVLIFLAIVFFPTVGAGAGAWYVVHEGQFGYLSAILWVIFVLCQLANMQLGQPGTTFDPTQLIRFPLNFRGYAVIRVFFGLLAPANIVTVLMSIAVAVGITVAAPEAWPFAWTSMAAFALCNIFFTRMIFAWVDRWLSTRRAREVFTAVIFIFGMTVQYLNFHYNLGARHNKHLHAESAARIAQAETFYHHVAPYLAKLPPGLAADAIRNGHLTHYGVFAAEVAGVLLYTLLFLGIFAARLYKEFRGENLSDTANAVSAKHKRKEPAAAPLVAVPGAALTTDGSRRNVIAAVFEKEFLILRRNTGVFYALVAPLIMVVLFANLKAQHTPPRYMFPAAIAYTLMGIAPLCYNALGAEGAGIQFYSLAPVSMRDVFLAKNFITIGLAVAEFIAVFIAITFVNSIPDIATTLYMLFWAVFTLTISLAVGNMRSITAPKKLDLTKMNRNQAGGLSALISIGLLLVSAVVGAGLYWLLSAFFSDWVMPPAMLVFAVVGVLIYRKSLEGLDNLFRNHRDTIAETLGKV